MSYYFWNICVFRHFIYIYVHTVFCFFFFFAVQKASCCCKFNIWSQEKTTSEKSTIYDSVICVQRDNKIKTEVEDIAQNFNHRTVNKTTNEYRIKKEKKRNEIYMQKLCQWTYKKGWICSFLWNAGWRKCSVVWIAAPLNRFSNEIRCKLTEKSTQFKWIFYVWNGVPTHFFFIKI